MFAVTVTFRLHPGTRDAFLPLVRQNATVSFTEEFACLRFDVCSDPDTPELVFLYEIYDDEAAFLNHCRAPHFLEFSAATDSMVAVKEVCTFKVVDVNDA